MKTRAEAVALINERLGQSAPPGSEKRAHHYGKVELRELMDFIYGGPPTQDDERIERG
jgi:hypothetical protein